MNPKRNSYISKEQLTIIFISDYFDFPITGLALYKNANNEQTVRFSCEEALGSDDIIYRIEQLSSEELAYEMTEKETFERCVGFHWSFDPQTGEPLQACYVPNQPDVTRAYYENQSKKQRPHFPAPVLLGWCGQIR